jgi:hypothetical protein
MEVRLCIIQLTRIGREPKFNTAGTTGLKSVAGTIQGLPSGSLDG